MFHCKIDQRYWRVADEGQSSTTRGCRQYGGGTHLRVSAWQRTAALWGGRGIRCIRLRHQAGRRLPPPRALQPHPARPSVQCCAGGGAPPGGAARHASSAPSQRTMHGHTGRARRGGWATASRTSSGPLCRVQARFHPHSWHKNASAISAARYAVLVPIHPRQGNLLCQRTAPRVPAGPGALPGPSQSSESLTHGVHGRRQAEPRPGQSRLPLAPGCDSAVRVRVKVRTAQCEPPERHACQGESPVRRRACEGQTACCRLPVEVATVEPRMCWEPQGRGGSRGRTSWQIKAMWRPQSFSSCCGEAAAMARS